MNSQDFGTRPSVTIRPPSTANLMVDSADRNQGATPWNFQISKNESILNGFFTRIGTTEVVLEWCYDNIQYQQPSAEILFDISGYISNPVTVTILPGQYNVEQALGAVAKKFNDVSGSTGTFTYISTLNNKVSLVFASTTTAASVPVKIYGNPGNGWSGRSLQEMIDLTGFSSLGPNVPLPLGRSFVWYVDCPDLRPYRYLDFVSPDLTYAQYLKDSSTSIFPRDVLCRWYMAEDTQEAYDGLGFPILMGYTRFCRRRTFNPPKQIRWDANLPIGGIRFEVYDQDGNMLMWNDQDTNWLMTLQVSEN